MFCLRSHEDQEAQTSQFTALSLSTGNQGATPVHFPCHVAEKMQPPDSALTTKSGSPYKSKENLMKTKRQRGLNGKAFAMEAESGNPSKPTNEVHYLMEPVRNARFRAGNGVHGGGNSRSKPYPLYNECDEGNADKVRADEETSPYQQSTNGLMISENGNKRSAYGRDGKGTTSSSDLRRKNGKRRNAGGRGDCASSSEVNDSSKACPHNQPVDGLSSESGNKTSAYRRGYSTSGNMSASEKIRHRMIKNRESAARSRARKQALEAQQQLENTELKKENDLLKRIVRFLLAIIRTKHMKLPALTRSFSAPL
ncbi:hypothetical protein Tsubulata_023754 [Turnera subulata]|uniref:BZIP domain-containing protein n=1 Tax=Turnera subulata TaxID=218843 RepID=A0A9Q0FCG9_9ROSI|nr:hypothetical protein Tsubulata_023754 [Turnera subulata]